MQGSFELPLHPCQIVVHGGIAQHGVGLKIRGRTGQRNQQAATSLREWSWLYLCRQMRLFVADGSEGFRVGGRPADAMVSFAISARQDEDISSG
ncbi:hypothetical protein [Bradyrhizobium sp. AS23.2]|uniref:hypothetical protein n=1 Tax=Bradyrhizobium sp. AS23.2 TaxID=1680155 RepID=UPI0014322BE0|nr:hypothetical protein [Bradyrhizobium sp. AS23.2]